MIFLCLSLTSLITFDKFATPACKLSLTCVMSACAWRWTSDNSCVPADAGLIMAMIDNNVQMT